MEQAGNVKGGVAMAIQARALATVHLETIDARDGASIDRGGGVGSKCATLQRVVSKGVGASAKWADAHIRLGRAAEGGVAQGPTMVALLEGRAVAEAFNVDGFAEEGWVAFLKVEKDGVVGINEREDNGAM